MSEHEREHEGTSGGPGPGAGQRRSEAEDRKKPSTGLTTDPHDPRLGHGSDDEATGMNEAYLVLSDEERAKGFVRPYRAVYVHEICGTQTWMGGDRRDLRAPADLLRRDLLCPLPEAQAGGRRWGVCLARRVEGRDLMPALTIILDVERDGFRSLRGFAAPVGDAYDPRVIHLGEDAEIELGALEGGMASGAPSVAFCFTLPDGNVVVAETSMALLLTAADALKARYGDPRR